MSKVKDFIQAQIARHTGHLSDEMRAQFAPEHQVEFELTGDGGGLYHLKWDAGNLLLLDGRAPTPLVAVSTSADGLIDMMTGKMSRELDVRQIDPMSGLKLNPITMVAPNKVEHVKKLKGTLRIRICEGSVPNDDVLSESLMAFNGEPIERVNPRCTVIMPVVGLERLASGAMTAPQLFMAGGMRAVGDMQLLMLMTPLVH
jgi:hypothetical protein